MIYQKYLAIQIRGQQAAAHRFDNVLIESLKVLELFALGFEFNALFAKRLRQQAPKVCNRDKRKKVAGQPGIQNARCGVRTRGMGKDTVISELDYGCK